MTSYDDIPLERFLDYNKTTSHYSSSHRPGAIVMSFVLPFRAGKS